MRTAGFILVIDSYLLRKGVAAVINRIQGARILKEFDSVDPVKAYMKSHHVDYMIMGLAAFDRSAELFIAQPDLLERTVLVNDVPGQMAAEKSGQDARTIIHLNEDKESINLKVRSLLEPGSGMEAGALPPVLSPRETTIVRLVSMGLTNRQIAEKLFLSAHTVMTHRKNISGKLGIKSVSGLTIYAIVHNIITIEEVSSLAAK